MFFQNVLDVVSNYVEVRPCWHWRSSGTYGVSSVANVLPFCLVNTWQSELINFYKLFLTAETLKHFVLDYIQSCKSLSLRLSYVQQNNNLKALSGRGNIDETSFYK